MKVDLLVACGAEDPNTRTILAASKRLGLTTCSVIPERDDEPAVTWDPANDEIWVENQKIDPQGVFIRYDHFGPGAYEPEQCKTDRAMGWYATVASWAHASTNRNLFNRYLSHSAGLKGYAISRAFSLGLPLPKTLLTNSEADMSKIGELSETIAKPAGGGAFTCVLKDVTGEPLSVNTTKPAPAIVQEMLQYPEVRVYVVGSEIFVFETYADSVDFRSDPKAQSQYLPSEKLPPKLIEVLLRLAEDLGLDFCAYDLKTRAETGELCFLEVNSAPMFSAFDVLSGGELSDAMVKWLSKSN